jgi:hypothetical protein
MARALGMSTGTSRLQLAGCSCDGKIFSSTAPAV